ncbi:MAG: polyprenyl synthetase family protein [Methanomicrobiales archaeon]|nr:polyprenyl synthetase family protein [Methanomicrobiales archaeon]
MNADSSVVFPALADTTDPNNFIAYLQKIRPRVNDRIREIVEIEQFDDQLLPVLLRGKRLRAGVLLLIHEVLASEPERTGPQALELACALELAHAASLIVDDIIDEDMERRGLETLHLAQGTKTALLESIGILSLPYTVVAPLSGEYVRMLAEVQRQMTFGALQEMCTIRALPAFDVYASIITLKTGRLFGLASEWGFLAADGGISGSKRPSTEGIQQQSLRDTWRRYGTYLGRSMQMADDIVDLKSGMRGTYSGTPGSELLLLNTMDVNPTIDECISDRRNCSAGRPKIQSARNSEFILQRAHQFLRTEQENARHALQNIEDLSGLPGYSTTPPSKKVAILRVLGQSIADIILEGTTVREYPVFIDQASLKPGEIPVKND